MSNVQMRLVKFCEAVSRLASPAEEQRQYLVGLGVAESLDELALEFDDQYRPLEPVLRLLPNRVEVLVACQALDDALASETLGWRFENLISVEWAHVRALATRVNEVLCCSTD